MNRNRVYQAAAIGFAIAAVAAAADSAGPEAAFRAYATAMTAGDTAGAAKWVIADARHLTLLAGRHAAAETEAKFQAAIAKAFPNAAPTTEPATRPADTTVHVDHDTAIVTTRDAVDPVKLRRVDGAWKVDLNATYPDEVVDDLGLFRHAMCEVLQTLTADVAAGKFKTYPEVQSELETRIKMRLATPDELSTTRPVL